MEPVNQCAGVWMPIDRQGDAVATAAGDALSEEADALESAPTSRGESDAPAEPTVLLGRALEARAPDIAQMVLETWEAGKSESYNEDERVRQDVLRFVVSGSAQA